MRTNDARRALLARLIDHAPTFPPASLPPADALAEDARAASSSHAFMLARLVWPVSALAVVSSLDRAISAVLDVPLPEGVLVEAVEVAPDFDLDALPLNGDVYVEIPLHEDLEHRLDRIAERGLRAKVRCGGASVPSSEALARFVRVCRERRLVYKATAGLHHALRTDREHGFLNLLAASLFEGDEDDALEEREPAAFAVDSEAFRWRDRAASAEEITRVRQDLCHSIGSCSFFEPVEELEKLRVLPL